jgi:neuralized-like protein 4
LWLKNKKEFILISFSKVNPKYCGSIRLGLTSRNPSSVSESGLSAGLVGLGKETIWIEGCDVKRNDEKRSGKVVRRNYCNSLDRLKIGDRIGVRFSSGDGSVKFFVNGEDCGSVAETFSGKKLFPVVELYGSTVSISAIR